jgi:hypothetical protein
VRITLTRTGGLAGLRQKTVVDDTALPPPERAELRRLVAKAALFSLPSELSGPSPAPDRFRYRLSAEDGGRRCDVRAAEETLPEELRRLVRWLEERLPRRG